MKTKLHLFIALLLVTMVSNVKAQLPIFDPSMAIVTYGTVSIPGDGEAIDKIIDGDLSTKFLNFDGELLDSGFDVDLGGVTAVANRIDITTGGDEPKRDISSVVISGSDDGTTWTEIATVDFPCDQERTFTSAVEFINTTAYGHYRIYFASLCDATTDMTQVAEIQLYDTTQDAPQNKYDIFDPSMAIVTYGTVSIPGDGEAIDKIIDGDLSTKFLNFDGELLDSGFDVDLGGVTAVANRIDITTGGDEPKRDISSVVISGSDDGTTWTEIATVDFPCDQPRTFTTAVDFVNTTSYGNYRIHFAALCDATTDMTQVAEIQLYNTTYEPPKTIFNTSMSVTPYGATVNWGGDDTYHEGPYMAIDGRTDTKFFNSDGADGTGFTVDLVDMTAVAVELILTTANDAPERDAASYEVFGSNDDITYDLISSGDIADNDVRFSETSYTFTNTTSYQYYRINFPTLRDGTQTLFQIAETQLIYEGDLTSIPDNKVFYEGMPFTVADGNDSPAAEAVEYSLDGLFSTKWLNFAGNLGSGFTADMEGNASAAIELRLTTANDAPGRDPVSYVLSGSNDGVTFVDVATGDVPCDNRRHLVRSFDISNSKAYSYYKFSFPTLCDAGQNLFQISDVILFHDGTVVADLVFNVTFTVLEGVNAIEGASVEFNGETLTTDASGQAVFANVSAVTDGAYTVSDEDIVTFEGTLTVIDEDVAEDVAVSLVGIKGFDNSKISIYPNPTKDILNIHLEQDFITGSYTIYSAIGNVLESNQITKMLTSCDLSSYSSGIYFIKISKDDESITKKFVVK